MHYVAECKSLQYVAGLQEHFRRIRSLGEERVARFDKLRMELLTMDRRERENKGQFLEIIRLMLCNHDVARVPPFYQRQISSFIQFLSRPNYSLFPSSNHDRQEPIPFRYHVHFNSTVKSEQTNHQGLVHLLLTMGLNAYQILLRTSPLLRYAHDTDTDPLSKADSYEHQSYDVANQQTSSPPQSKTLSARS